MRPGTECVWLGWSQGGLRVICCAAIVRYAPALRPLRSRKNNVQSPTVFDEETCYRCRGDFPSLWRTFGTHPVAFLDGPGGTQVPKSVIDAIADCYRNRNVNTHGNFPPSAELDERVLEARCAVADLLDR